MARFENALASYAMAANTRRSRSYSRDRCQPQQDIATQSRTSSLRILTFNIQSAWRAERSEEPLLPVARLLDAVGADINCLQEIQISDANASGDQPAAVARLLSDMSRQRWHHAFGSHHLFGSGAEFGNAVLWPGDSACHIRHPAYGVFNMDGDSDSKIGAHRQGRCAVGVLLAEPLHAAVVTVHLGFLARGVEMIRELLDWLRQGEWAERTVILCGDFNTYPEEGINADNVWEKTGRYIEMMALLGKSGFLKTAGRGKLVPPEQSGLSPDVAVPEIAGGVYIDRRPQQPCFITFPYWTDQGRHLDSHDHQIDYFFVRPRRGVEVKVRQIVPVAAHGISDHHGLLLEIQLKITED